MSTQSYCHTAGMDSEQGLLLSAATYEPEMRTAKLDEEEDNIFMSPFCSRHFESFISI